MWTAILSEWRILDYWVNFFPSAYVSILWICPVKLIYYSCNKKREREFKPTVNAMSIGWSYVDSDLSPQWPSKNLLWENQLKSRLQLSVLSSQSLCICDWWWGFFCLSFLSLPWTLRVFGHFSLRSEWQLVKVDYKSIFSRHCTKEDYQTWHLLNQVHHTVQREVLISRRGATAALVVIPGPPHLEEEGRGPTEDNGGFGGRVETHISRSSRWYLGPFASWYSDLFIEITENRGERWQWYPGVLALSMEK